MLISTEPLLTPGLYLRRRKKGKIFSFFTQSGVKSLLFFGLGRVALFNGLKILGCQKGDNVLLPSYICRSAVAPFHRLGIGVRFYKVLSNLKPDMMDIENKIDGKTKAILTVNYFGFPQPDIKEIQQFCHKHQLYLIEDNAHSFLSRDGSRLLGTFGDIGFASIWKTLPVPDGAVLLINNDVLIEKSKSQLSLPLRSGPLRIKSFGYLLVSLLKHLENRYKFPLRSLRYIYARTLAEAGGDDDDDERRWSADALMSGLSLGVMDKIDIDEVIVKRRRNYQFWRKLLKGTKGVELLFENIPVGICPQVFPVIMENQKDFSKELRRRGISTSLWPYLPGEVEGSRDYPIANFLAEHLLVLPLHQDIEPDFLRKTVRGLI